MTVESIDEIAALLQGTPVNRIAVEGEGWSLEIERPAGAGAPFADTADRPAALAAPESVHSAAEAEPLTTVEAPVVGVFHEVSPSVTLGSGVRSGQLLGSIEALALRNEVRAPADGEIAEVHVEDGQPVEFGQPLFRIREGVLA